MPFFLSIVIQGRAGVIWQFSDVHEQSISLNANYLAWIIVHYHFWIILAIIFNIVFFASLHYDTKKQGEWLECECRYAETISRLYDQSNVL